MRTLFVVLCISVLGMSAALAQFSANPLADQIQRLRDAREKAIADAITKANNDYAQALTRLQNLYASDAGKLALVKREEEEAHNIGLVSVPPALKITAPLGSETLPAKHEKPNIHSNDQLERYLIGTKWNFFQNDQFQGPSIVLEFTGPGKATQDGKQIVWKVLEKDKVWLEGNRAYTFNKVYDTFVGGWVPNSSDKSGGKLVTP